MYNSVCTIDLCLPLAYIARPSTLFRITKNVFERFSNAFCRFEINSTNSCIRWIFWTIKINKISFKQSTFWFVKNRVGYNVNITIVVFDYVYWKLSIASFFLKSSFCLFKHMGSDKPRNILFTTMTTVICQHFPSSENIHPIPSFMDPNAMNME